MRERSEPYTPDAKPTNARHADTPADDRPGTRTHGPQGTTHDPNSVTTGTSAEPDDVYPPKGERRGDA